MMTTASSGRRRSPPSGWGSSTCAPATPPVDAAAEEAYRRLTAAGLDPLLDDRDERPGAKFATADLIGLPWRLVIGPKGVAAGEVELKNRRTGEQRNCPLDEAVAVLARR